MSHYVSHCASLFASHLQDIDLNMNLAQVLFEGVVSLQDAYHMSVATEDLDKSINYCRIFTEMAESFLEAIVERPNHVSMPC